jgi:hypothetical protein
MPTRTMSGHTARMNHPNQQGEWLGFKATLSHTHLTIRNFSMK